MEIRITATLIEIAPQDGGWDVVRYALAGVNGVTTGDVISIAVDSAQGRQIGDVVELIL